MKDVTIKSIYGKTLAFKDYSGSSHSGAVEVVARNDEGEYTLGMVFSKAQIDSLREALKEPEVPSLDVYMLMRHPKDKPFKIRACYAMSTDSKEFLSKRAAQDACDRMNTSLHGTKHTYFLVKKV
jgi:hypothetical protein